MNERNKSSHHAKCCALSIDYMYSNVNQFIQFAITTFSLQHSEKDVIDFGILKKGKEKVDIKLVGGIKYTYCLRCYHFRVKTSTI